MKRLLLLSFLFFILSCNQQTILYGSGTITESEYLATDSILSVDITLDNRLVSIVKDTINAIRLSTDENLHTSYAVTYDSLLKKVIIEKTADQQLLDNGFTLTIHTKSSPQNIRVSNCSLAVSEMLYGIKHIDILNGAKVTAKSMSDSLAVIVCDSSRIELSGQNRKQSVSLKKGATYGYFHYPLYSAMVSLEPGSICSLAVEKEISGVIEDEAKLFVKGGPLIKAKHDQINAVEYFH